MADVGASGKLSGGGRISLKPTARGLFFLSAGEIFAKLVSFFPTVYLARVVGPEGFGIIAYALAVVSYFILIVDFGLTIYGVRGVARGLDPSRLAGEVLTLRLMLTVPSILLLLAIVPFLGKTPLELSVIRWSAVLIFSYAVMVTWVFQGLERMGVVALASVLIQLGYASGVFLLVHAPEHLARVPVAQAVAETGVSLLLLALLLRRGIRPRFRLSMARVREITQESFPLAGVRILRSLLYNISIIILGILLAKEAVGLFSAAYRVIYALLTINILLGTALLPLTSRTHGEDLAVVRRLITRLGYATTAVTLPAALGISMLAGPILTLCFGASFAGAAPSLSLIAWGILLIPLGENFRRVLWSFHLQVKDFRGLVVSVVVMVTACLALVPRWGITGAAVGFVASEVVLLLTSMFSVKRHITRFSFLRELRPPLVSAVLMGAAVLPAREWGIVPAIAIGAVVYSGALAIQRGIPTELFMRRES